MRRAILIALMLVLIDAYPAAAHPSVLPTSIERNQSSSLVFQVYGDEIGSPLEAVEISIPSTFKLEKAVPPSGWKSKTDDRAVRISGGTLQSAADPLVFTFSGTASALGFLEFPMTVVYKNGARIAFDGKGVRQPLAVFVKDPDEKDSVPIPLIAALAILAVIGVTAYLSKRDG